MQTLPPFVQSRVLSFLAYENQRFCRSRLRSIASHIVNDEHSGVGRNREYFWVFSAAHNLLDAMHDTHGVTRDHEDGQEIETEFSSCPSWLIGLAQGENPTLPWLPISPSQVCDLGRGSSLLPEEEEEEEEEEEKEEELTPEQEKERSSTNAEIKGLSPSTSERLLSLKCRIVTVASLSEVEMVMSEIRALCFNHDEKNNQKSLEILNLLELWRIEDEVAAVFLTQMYDFHISGLLLASIVLPKLVILKSPVSRVLLSAIVEFCKLHKVAAINALTFPLILLKEGINIHHCDLMSKIVRECLHPSQVSAFCQKLLQRSSLKEDIICLPSLHSSISEELVWTESLFSFFQQILIQGVQLTPDAVDSLVSVVEESVVVHRKSLKFCNFLLCMISKCPHAVQRHKLSLIRTSEKTETFLTKSILSKLTSQ